MRSLILFVAFSAVAILPASSHPHYGIQRAYAYFKHVIHGALLVDEKGFPMKTGEDVERFIYLENKGNLAPKISTVLYKGKLYDAAVFDVHKKTITIGKRKSTGKLISLTAHKGYKLWKIELSPDENKKQHYNKTYQSKILIYGPQKDRPAIKTITYETELEGELKY